MNIPESNQWPPTCSVAFLHQRAALYQTVRTFFIEKNVLEVETPILSNASSCDVNLDIFSTVTGGNITKARRLYMQTSPEFAMKRLLAAGAGSIYQIAKSFRQAESGRFHNPEFSLLEWYRVGFDLEELMEEVLSLLIRCFGRKIPLKILTYQDLFQQITTINPHATNQQELINYAALQGNSEAATICGDSLSNALDYVFSQYIQPQLTKDQLYFVRDYPVCMAMLAKLDDKKTVVTAKRFEVYFNNLELANGYEELTDAKQQEQRFQQDIIEREEQKLETVPIDKHLIGALESGLPDCSGVALGLDRLLMLMEGARSIDEVLAFPIGRA